MGLCKGCGIIYSALIMKDGYCKDCKPELFSEMEINQIDNNGMVEVSYNEVEKTKMNKNLMLSLLVIGISLSAYFIYDFLTTPSSSVVKELASKYTFIGEKFKILKSYEDKGKLVYVLEIYNSVCEMPMIKTSNGWSATGMSCTRKEY